MATEEVTHLAYRRVSDSSAPWNRQPPEPRSAVCAGDAEGPLTYEVDETSCSRCAERAKQQWWDLERRPLWYDQVF